MSCHWYIKYNGTHVPYVRNILVSRQEVCNTNSKFLHLRRWHHCPMWTFASLISKFKFVLILICVHIDHNCSCISFNLDFGQDGDNASFEVLLVLLLKKQVSCNITPCQLVECYYVSKDHNTFTFRVQQCKESLFFNGLTLYQPIWHNCLDLYLLVGHKLIKTLDQ